MAGVISLLASATEIVCALGCRERLVARSHECDYPEDVASLPVASRPSFPVAGTSRAIHLAIEDRLRKALSIYSRSELIWMTRCA
jgi:iron complex transport system substrate-binding protein